MMHSFKSVMGSLSKSSWLLVSNSSFRCLMFTCEIQEDETQLGVSIK